MHGIIIQLEEEPLESKEEYASAMDFYEDFVGQVADYVSDDIDRDEEIKYFVEEMKKYGISYDEKKQSIVFLEGFKERYFAERFFKLKEVVKNLTLEEFAKDSSKAWGLTQLIEKKYGTYVYNSDSSWMTFDDFVRDQLEEGKTYYIGGIVDYHF